MISTSEKVHQGAKRDGHIAFLNLSNDPDNCLRHTHAAQKMATPLIASMMHLL